MSTLRYWAAAREAAGTAAQVLPAGTLAKALLLARASRDDRFSAVLGLCSYVVDGDPVGGRDHATIRLPPMRSSTCCLPSPAGDSPYPTTENPLSGSRCGMTAIGTSRTGHSGSRMLCMSVEYQGRFSSQKSRRTELDSIRLVM